VHQDDPKFTTAVSFLVLNRNCSISSSVRIPDIFGRIFCNGQAFLTGCVIHKRCVRRGQSNLLTFFPQRAAQYCILTFLRDHDTCLNLLDGRSVLDAASQDQLSSISPCCWVQGKSNKGQSFAMISQSQMDSSVKRYSTCSFDSFDIHRQRSR